MLPDSTGETLGDWAALTASRHAIIRSSLSRCMLLSGPSPEAKRRRSGGVAHRMVVFFASFQDFRAFEVPLEGNKGLSSELGSATTLYDWL